MASRPVDSMALTMAEGAAVPVMLMSWVEREAETLWMPGMEYRDLETDWMQESQERGTANVVSKGGISGFVISVIVVWSMRVVRCGW